MSGKNSAEGRRKIARQALSKKARQSKPLPVPAQIDPKLAEVMLFTKAQMATLLQVSLRTLENMMHLGEVSYLRINGKLVRFHAKDVIRRLNEVARVNAATSAEGEDE